MTAAITLAKLASHGVDVAHDTGGGGTMGTPAIIAAVSCADAATIAVTTAGLPAAPPPAALFTALTLAMGWRCLSTSASTRLLAIYRRRGVQDNGRWRLKVGCWSRAALRVRWLVRTDGVSGNCVTAVNTRSALGDLKTEVRRLRPC